MSRILIIEDDEVVAALLVEGLAGDGYETEVATTLAEGRRLATGSAHDLIVLDLQLPDGLGYDLARALRAAGSVTPILMLTARADSASVVEGLDAGADDYLAKPFELPVLTARIRALLRRGPASAAPRLEYGSLSIDRIARQVSDAGRPIRLTPKEYELLEFLMLRSEETHSRADLLSAIWGIRFDPGSNLTDVTVARLRRKLSGGDVEISSLRGQGYRLTRRAES